MDHYFTVADPDADVPFDVARYFYSLKRYESALSLYMMSWKLVCVCHVAFAWPSVSPSIIALLSATCRAGRTTSLVTTSDCVSTDWGMYVLHLWAE